MGHHHDFSPLRGVFFMTGFRPALTVRTTALREDKWACTLAANGSIIPWQEAIISAQVQGGVRKYRSAHAY